MAKIDITRTELVWPGKYDDDGNRREVPSVSLPFQVIETVNESRATRDAAKARKPSLFDIWEAKEGETFEDGWRNKLIWGDNRIVMSSLRQRCAGEVDLIYIDPPFATGTDFSFLAEIGDGLAPIHKEQSIIEEKAYRDTWGSGLHSYIPWLHSALVQAKELLSSSGSIYVHLDNRVTHHARILLDEVLGADAFQSAITWKRTSAHSSTRGYGPVQDVILYYALGDNPVWNAQYQPYEQEYIDMFYEQVDPDGKRWKRGDLTGPGTRTGESGKTWRGIDVTAKGRHWQPASYVYDKYRKVTGTDLAQYPFLERLDKLDEVGLLHWPSGGKGVPRYKSYLEDMPGIPLQDIWTDIRPLHNLSDERVGYPTQKPESLLDRIVRASSNPGDLVMDFFCGSGTTLAVAEKLGRRWIGCDLGRFAIHTTRKRILEIDGSKPFEVLNLGKYERQFWQGATFGGASKAATEQALYEYLAFILKLYGAQPVSGLAHLHGKLGRAMVHIGAVDAPVTIDEINAAITECKQVKQTELHVLGWEWEMGLYDLMVGEAKRQDIKLLLLQIPREVMEQQAVDKGDIQFFELAYLEVTIAAPKKLTSQVTLTNFVIPNTELIPEDVRAKVKKWSDYIDYWAVDWDFQNDTFMQGWVTYRTRQDRSLSLVSDPHTYPKAGKYRVLVKVVDIFGNDTSQAFDVEVR